MSFVKPEYLLKSALAKLAGTDPRIVELRNADPVAYLITGNGRKLELFSTDKLKELTTKKKNYGSTYK